MTERIKKTDNGKVKWIDWKGLVVDTLYLRDNGLCSLCLRAISDKDLFEIDHIVERKDGGPDTLRNLRLVHLACHKARHNTGGATISPDIIRAASIIRGITAIKQAEKKADIDDLSDKQLLALIKKVYADTKSMSKTASICGMGYDQLHYFKSKHNLTGKPDEWIF